jgi:O-antigen/teichoic acid export membrane protein
MRLFVSNFKWVMLVSGLLTCTMFLGLFSPSASLMLNFGETMRSPVDEIIVRNWAALIGISGLMLIYGAFAEAVRRFVLVIACASKITFVCLIGIFGQQYLAFEAGTAVVVDLVMIVLFLAYLLLGRLGSVNA